MLLKAGIAMILFSLALAAVTVTAVALRADSPEATVLPAEPRSAEVKQAEEKKFDPGKKLEIDKEPDEEQQPEPRPEPSSDQPAPEEPGAGSPGSEDPLPEETGTGSSRSDEGSRPVEPSSSLEVPDWPRPTKDEVVSAEAPRYYTPTSGTSMSLTIEALGLYDVPVINSYSYETLDRGLMHEPDTTLPWDGGAQRNVYIAGHYLGWPGTASHLVFYNLDKLKSGDEILLKDSAGNGYKYRVSESFMAGPDESWVMGQVQGRDMLTLQTCIPPTFEDRLVVRADRA